MRPARLLLILALLAAAAPAGCGSSNGDATESNEARTTATATTPPAPPGAAVRSCEGKAAGADDVRVTGIDCDGGRGVITRWASEPSCSAPAGASRFACTVHGGYRCLGATTGRGIAVSCAHPGSSVSFVAKRG